MSETTSADIDLIVFDRRAYPRAEVSDERIVVLRDLYAANGPSALPPIDVVVMRDGTLILADGAHRLSAAYYLRWTEIPVHVIPVPDGLDSIECAYLHSLDQATSTAKPLTRAERLRAMRRLLDDHPEWADREIARRSGTSHTTVAKARNADSSPSGELDESEVFLTRRASDKAAIALARAVSRAWRDRGLTDLLLNRMPGTLAAALEAEFGDEAPLWAERLEGWAAKALVDLKRRGGGN